MSTPYKAIRITPEAISKYKGATVDDAILQAIYNSIDADATEIHLFIKDSQNSLFSGQDDAAVCESFIVQDNGCGIEFERLDEIFLPFEKSWKQGVSRKFQRPYHGSRGSGRFKYFALGQKLEWKTTYKKDNAFYSYEMILDMHNPTHLQYTNPKQTTANETGTTLKISTLTTKAVKFCTKDNITDELISGLILDLELSENLSIFIQDIQIDSKKMIEKRSDPIVRTINDPNNTPQNVSCEIIAWIPEVKFTDHKHSFFYNSKGQYIDKKPSGVPADTRMPLHTLIIRSQLFDNYSAFEANFTSIYHRIEKAFETDVIKFLTDVRYANLSSQLNSIIQSTEYPFHSIPSNVIEDAEHTAYNACLYTLLAENGAVISAKKPQIMKVVFPLLKRAFSGDYILSENIDSILQLSNDDSEKYNRMVSRIRLSKLISRYDKLRHRFDFLEVLNKLVHEKTLADKLEERTQLHRIVAEEVWIFGKEYDNENLVTSDRSIVTLIRQLNARTDFLFEDADSDKVLEEAEAYIKEHKNDLESCLKKIPDLVLCKIVNNSHENTKIHLVIELKKPKIPIDGECKKQALKVYTAISNAANNRGGLEISDSHKWRYCLVSTGISDSLRNDFTANKHLEEKANGNYVIDCLKWQDIIEDAKKRLDVELQDINIQASDSDCQELLKIYKERFGVKIN